MLLIPGPVISLISFPGVIIHEWAHKKFCEWTGVPVHKVVYFRFGNPAGYVEHGEPHAYRKTFWISFGPFVINTAGAILFGFLVGIMPDSMRWLGIFFAWVAMSAGMHSFPSDHDTKHILSESKRSLKDGGSVFHYLAYPFFILFWIANKLKFFWFDVLYAFVAVVIGVKLAVLFGQ